MKRVITIGAILVVLSGCMSMSFKGMYKMATLDPLAIEPSELRLALRTDQVVKVKTGSVTMQLEFTVPAHKHLPSLERKHKFDIEVKQFDVNQSSNMGEAETKMAHQLPEILLDGIQVNEQVTLLYLSPQDAEAMAETQAQIKKYKAAGAKGKGMLSFDFNESCLLNTEQMVSLPVDLFLKTAKGEEFFMFFEDLDVVKQASERDVDLKQINRCDVG
ncbi:MAG: hypothetical protein HWE10_06315 [Gammaproteobacteria bacterium]|nr:hypothetical protein [Gammaproteobacteria bacterium]